MLESEMDFDEIMSADRLRKADAIRQAELAAQAEKVAKTEAAARIKTHLAAVTPVFQAMRTRWESKFKSFPEYRCVGQTSPTAGPPKGIRWIRVSISPAKGGPASRNFDIHASVDLESGTIQVLGYSERYPTVVIETGLSPAAVNQEKIDDLLAKFAAWFTSLGQRSS